MKQKTFSIKEALSFGWEKQQSNFLFFAGITLVAAIPNIIFDAVSDIAENSNLFLRVGISIISLIVMLFFSLGVRKITLEAYDNKELKFSDLFSQKNLLISVLGASIIYFIFIFIGALALIIPGIFIFCRLLFYEIAIVDKKMGAIESLKDSWRITKGNALKIFILILFLIIINILGALAILIGLLITVPITALSLTYVYRKLSESYKEEEPEEVI